MSKVHTQLPVSDTSHFGLNPHDDIIQGQIKAQANPDFFDKVGKSRVPVGFYPSQQF